MLPHMNATEKTATSRSGQYTVTQPSRRLKFRGGPIPSSLPNGSDGTHVRGIPGSDMRGRRQLLKMAEARNARSMR